MNFSQLKHSDGIFIDANIFIYNFGGQSLQCKEFLLRCAKQELWGYTSTAILAEVLHRLMIAEAIEKRLVSPKNPMKKLKESPQLIKQLISYNENVRKIGEMNITILELTHFILEKSAAIRQKEGLLTNDSLVIAFMKDFSLTKLATHDNDFDHVEDIEVYKPTDL